MPKIRIGRKIIKANRQESQQIQLHRKLHSHKYDIDRPTLGDDKANKNRRIENRSIPHYRNLGIFDV